MENILNFFTSKPSQVNFITFGPIHLFILFIAAIISIFIFKKQFESRRAELLIGSVLIFQQAILYLWYFVGGYNSMKEGLPLYHCRIAIILVAIGLISKNKICTKLGSYLGSFGSISALLFPGLDPFSFPHVTQFSYFIGHLFLLWSSIYLLTVKKIGMSKVDLRISLICINIYHLLMYNLNKFLNSNYGYMNAPPFELGFDLPDLLYALLVMFIFSIVLIGEYILVNKLYISKEESKEYDLAF